MITACHNGHNEKGGSDHPSRQLSFRAIADWTIEEVL
jgi:hypothetical protein